jgi:hypothetical protein
MKITKSQLQQIIKEEMEAALREGFVGPPEEDDYARVKEALRKDKELWQISQSWGKRAKVIIEGLEHPEGHRYECWGHLSRDVEATHAYDDYGRAEVGVTWAVVEVGDEQ